MKDLFWNFFTQNGSVEAYLLYKSAQESDTHQPSDKEATIEPKCEGLSDTGDAGG